MATIVALANVFSAVPSGSDGYAAFGEGEEMRFDGDVAGGRLNPRPFGYPARFEGKRNLVVP